MSTVVHAELYSSASEVKVTPPACAVSECLAVTLLEAIKRHIGSNQLNVSPLRQDALETLLLEVCLDQGGRRACGPACLQV